MGKPQFLLHGLADESVPASLSAHYVELAQSLGDHAVYVPFPGVAHMEVISARGVPFEDFASVSTSCSAGRRTIGFRARPVGRHSGSCAVRPLNSTTSEDRGRPAEERPGGVLAASSATCRQPLDNTSLRSSCTLSCRYRRVSSSNKVGDMAVASQDAAIDVCPRLARTTRSSFARPRDEAESDKAGLPDRPGRVRRHPRHSCGSVTRHGYRRGPGSASSSHRRASTRGRRHLYSAHPSWLTLDLRVVSQVAPSPSPST